MEAFAARELAVALAFVASACMDARCCLQMGRPAALTAEAPSRVSRAAVVGMVARRSKMPMTY